MAGCVTLTKSRKLASNSPMPGVRAISIAEYDALNPIVTTATGVIDLPSIYGVASIARLELKNTTTNYVENAVSGGDSRSVGVTGNIPCVFNVPEGGDVETTKMVKELLKGEFVAFLELKSGAIVPIGIENGCQVVTADGSTGGTIGDLNGYTVTIQTMESGFSRENVMSGEALTKYAAGIMTY
jgi:hypothetical protein